MSNKVSEKETIFRKLLHRQYKTPDFDELRWVKEIPLLVYDENQFGTKGWSDLLNGSKYLGKGQTISLNFTMKVCDGIPVVFEEKVTPHATIKGDLFLVSPQHIVALDDKYETQIFTQRISTRVLYFEQENSKHLSNLGTRKWGHAYMYVYDRAMFKGKDLMNRTIYSSSVDKDARPNYSYDPWAHMVDRHPTYPMQQGGQSNWLWGDTWEEERWVG